jgi:hypothetical protein
MKSCLEEAKQCGAKGVIVSRIPGASHCAFEASMLATLSDLPLLEIEVSSLTDSYAPALMTRLQGFMEA